MTDEFHMVPIGRDTHPQFPNAFTVKHRNGMRYALNDLTAYLDEIEVWCEEQFGDRRRPTVRGIDGRWVKGSLTFYFRDEADAAAFRLRWG